MTSQSPIKLETINSLPLATPIDLLSIDYPAGQSFQGKFVGDDPSHGNFELVAPFPLITFKGCRFKLVKVHIHGPSEHLVNSNSPSDYEIHFLHVPEFGRSSDPKVVIGVLYRESDVSQAPKGFEDFVKRLPSREQMFSKSSPQLQAIIPTDFFPTQPDGTTPDLINWFHYEGSLTSFPYSEDVSWFVMKNMAIVPSAITEMLEQYAEQHVRELQPLQRRVVVRSFQNTLTESIITPASDRHAISADAMVEESDNVHRGSRMHILDLVSDDAFIQKTNSILEGTGWQLPDEPHSVPNNVASREYELEEYLTTYPFENLPSLDANWWITHQARRPKWDLICRLKDVNKNGLLLVEGKAHIRELSTEDRKSSPILRSERSLANDTQIRNNLLEAENLLNQSFRSPAGRFILSTDSHYQLANRLCYSIKLASMGYNVVLLYLGFQMDTYFRDPIVDEDHWHRIVGGYIQGVVPQDFVNRVIEIKGAGSLQMIVRSTQISRVSQPIAG